MNKLLCFLTGGHKYSSANTESTYLEHNRSVKLQNRCLKCGKIYTVILDIDKILAEDMRLRRKADDDR